MKTKEELDALKEEINKVNEKICELTPEELEQVNGGVLVPQFDIKKDWTPPSTKFCSRRMSASEIKY